MMIVSAGPHMWSIARPSCSRWKSARPMQHNQVLGMTRRTDSVTDAICRRGLSPPQEARICWWRVRYRPALQMYGTKTSMSRFGCKNDGAADGHCVCARRELTSGPKGVNHEGHRGRAAGDVSRLAASWPRGLVAGRAYTGPTQAA